MVCLVGGGGQNWSNSTVNLVWVSALLTLFYPSHIFSFSVLKLYPVFHYVLCLYVSSSLNTFIVVTLWELVHIVHTEVTVWFWAFSVTHHKFSHWMHIFSPYNSLFDWSSIFSHDIQNFDSKSQHSSQNWLQSFLMLFSVVRRNAFLYTKTIFEIMLSDDLFQFYFSEKKCIFRKQSFYANIQLVGRHIGRQYFKKQGPKQLIFR